MRAPISSIIEPSAKTSPAVAIGDGAIVAELLSRYDIGCSDGSILNKHPYYYAVPAIVLRVS